MTPRVGVVLALTGGDLEATRAGLLDQPDPPPVVEVATPRPADWNEGLRRLETEWACLVTPGEVSHCGRFEALLQGAALMTSAALVHTHLLAPGDAENAGETLPCGVGNGEVYHFLKQPEWYIPAGCAMVRRTAVLDLGGLDERLGHGAWWDLLLRLAARFSVGCVAEGWVSCGGWRDPWTDLNLARDLVAVQRRHRHDHVGCLDCRRVEQFQVSVWSEELKSRGREAQADGRLAEAREWYALAAAMRPSALLTRGTVKDLLALVLRSRGTVAQA